MFESCDDFIELLGKNLETGTKHHFTAKVKAQAFRDFTGTMTKLLYTLFSLLYGRWNTAISPYMCNQ